MVRYLTQYGYAGALYPITSRHRSIRGLRCYPTLADVPGPVDLALLCVGQRGVAPLLGECGEAGITMAVVFSDGFGQPGSERFEELREAADRAGVRVLGPNTNGLRSSSRGLIAEIGTGAASVGPSNGPVAVISQGGGLTYFGAALLKHRGAGTRYLIDTGSEVNFDVADAIDAVLHDDDVRAIGLILEGVDYGRKLMRAIGAACQRGRTVFVLKVARSQAGAEAALSHTGKIAGDAAVFASMLREAGAVVCRHPEELTDALALAARGVGPGRGGVGVITLSGGFGVLATDLAAEQGVELPALVARPSDADGPAHGTPSNPLDVSATGVDDPAAFAAALRRMHEQADIQAVAIWIPHQLAAAPRAVDGLVDALAAEGQRTDTPLILCGLTTDAVRRRLHAGRLLTTESPSTLFASLGLVIGDPDRHRLAGPRTSSGSKGTSLGADQTLCTGLEASELLVDARVPCARAVVVSTVDDAVAFLHASAGAAVLKIEGGGVAHKTEHGFVSGRITDEAQLRAAFATLDAKRSPLDGSELVIQEFVQGVEILLAAFRDEAFGPVVAVGAGGTRVELDADVAFASAPLTAATARVALSRLRTWPVLEGYRGAEACDVDELVQAMVALSELVARRPDIREVEVNPLIVRGKGHGVAAVDALIVFDAPDASHVDITERSKR